MLIMYMCQYTICLFVTCIQKNMPNTEKSTSLNSHGRAINKPVRYMTTESSADERPQMSYRPRLRIPMDQQILFMVDQVNQVNQENIQPEEDEIEEDIIANSQPDSLQSLTFSDVMRVAAPRVGGRAPVESTVTSTLHHIPQNINVANRADTIQANPFVGPAPTSNKAHQQLVKMLTESTTAHLQTFNKRQEERLESFKKELRKENRDDLRTLDEHIHNQLVAFEKAIKKTIQNDTKNLYPYERPQGFPLESLDNFLEFEADAERQQSLKYYLTHVGGITARDTLNQFLKETMVDSLIKKFSWTGGPIVDNVELRPLFNTRMGRVFYDALLACRHIPQLPDRTAFARLMQEAIRAGKQRLRDAARRPRAGRLSRRQQYLAEMDQHYESDSDNNNNQPED